MINCKRFTGKNALVVGGASGIGKAAAHRLAAKGVAAISSSRPRAGTTIHVDGGRVGLAL